MTQNELALQAYTWSEILTFTHAHTCHCIIAHCCMHLMPLPLWPCLHAYLCPYSGRL